MSKCHLIKNQPLLREIYKDPPLLSYRKGRSLDNVLIRAKLWRSKFCYLDQWESCLACQPFVSSNVAFQELALRSLKASPLIKPFLTQTGGRRQEVKCVYWKVSVGLKCVRTTRMDGPYIRMYPGKLFLYLNMLKFQPWILWSFWISNCWKFHGLKQTIHESHISQAINHAWHAFRYSRIAFLFK